MAAPRQKSRETITVRPYHWSAYNRVVKGNYFARRWLRDLKPVGAAIVIYLRSKCYANHHTGEYRYEVELDLGEIAEGIGVSLSTVKREFKENPHLAEFVQKQTQYEFTGQGNRVKKVASLYFVSVDEPIHPNDMERYEALLKEEGKPPGPREKVVIRRPAPDKCQNEPYRLPDKCQNEPYPGQSDPGAGQNDTYQTNKESSLLLFTSVTAALPPANMRPPEGVEDSDDPLAAAWQAALGLLKDRINTPAMRVHVAPLRLASVSEEGADKPGLSEALLLAPFASTLQYVEKRFLPLIEEALSHVLGKPMTAKLHLAKEQDDTGRSGALMPQRRNQREEI